MVERLGKMKSRIRLEISLEFRELPSFFVRHHGDGLALYFGAGESHRGN